MSLLLTYEQFQNSLVQRDAKWFIDVLNKVKEWQARGYKITDIYIKQNGISIGILKNFFRLPLSSFNGNRNEVRILTSFLYEQRLNQLGLSANVNRNAYGELESKRYKSFSLMVEGLGVLRCTFSRSNVGHVLTIRLLDFVLPTLETVRLAGFYKEFLESLMERVVVAVPLMNEPVSIKRIKRPGLIVHCGPTGSGKTTSITAQLNYLADDSGGYIITYEDPVEYYFLDAHNVLQYEIGVHLEREDIYHHFLRSTAQVGLVGEIRTAEEIRQVVDLASRGHLIYTTVHAGSVAEALHVLSEANRDNKNMLASVLLAVISQRLRLEAGKRIVPLYEMLLFKDGLPSVSQIRNQIREGEDVEKFLKNNLHSLSKEGVYINQL